MNHFSSLSKLKRYFDTAKLATGFATRLGAEKYFNISMDDEAYAAFLKETLGQLKGPLMKAAQFLTTIPDTLPKEYYTLIELQSQAPAMGIPFVKRRLKNELGPDWEKNFNTFDLNAISAASLGQVHKAQLTNNQNVAVKLQYPNMEGVTESDLQQLQFLFFLYQTYNKSIHTEYIYEELKERLYEELDYQKEADNIKNYRLFFKQHHNIHIPQVYNDFTTKRLLTMDWCDGTSILNFEQEKQEIKNKIGKILFNSWYLPLYKKGMLHGDPHPGNYLVQIINNEPHLTLLDFGCVRYFDATTISGIKNLFFGLLHNKKTQCIDAFEELGFHNLNNTLIDIILEWANMLYNPLLDDSIRPIQKDISPKDSLKIAQKIHDALKKEGGIRPPRTFVFLDRAAVGIGSVLMRLQSQQNWHQLFLEMID